MLAQAIISGQFSLENNNGHSLLPRGRKAIGLVAFLLWQGQRRTGREQLIDLFWSDRGRPQGMASLRQCLSEIRNSFGPLASDLLDVDRQQVSLKCNQIAFDIWDQDGKLHADAIGLLFDGIGSISPVFDDWVDQKRRELREHQVHIAETVLSDHDAQSDDKIAAALNILSHEPSNENAARILIAHYGDRGDLDRAKRVFEKLSRALAADDFDVSQETSSIFKQITSGAGTVTAAQPDTPNQLGPPSVAIGNISVIGTDPNHLEQLLASRLAARFASCAEIRLMRAEHSDGADYILDGLIALEGDLAHLSVAVTARATGEHLASIDTDVVMISPMKTTTTLVDRVVARAIPMIERHAALCLPEDQSLWNGPAHYLRARYLIATAKSPDYMEQVETHLREAVARSPEFSPPLAYLISSLNSGGRATRPGRDYVNDRQEAYDLARHFLILDALNPNAHLAFAWCLIRRRDFAMAELSLVETERLQLYDANRINSLGTAYVMLGDHEKGEKYYLLAQDLMLNDLDYMNTDWGELHYFRRNYAVALEFLSVGEARNPVYARFLKAAALAQLGDLAQAQREAEYAVEGLRKLWVGKGPYSPTSAVNWYFNDFSMRRQIDIDNLREGLTKAGFTLSDTEPFVDET